LSKLHWNHVFFVLWVRVQLWFSSYLAPLSFWKSTYHLGHWSISVIKRYNIGYFTLFNLTNCRSHRQRILKAFSKVQFFSSIALIQRNMREWRILHSRMTSQRPLSPLLSKLGHETKCWHFRWKWFGERQKLNNFTRFKNSFK